MEGRRNTAAVLVRSDVLLAQIRQQQSLNTQVSAAHNSQQNCHVEATAASVATASAASHQLRLNSQSIHIR